MARVVKHKRGTTAEIAQYTPAEGEFVYDTETHAIYTGDGATQGGFEIATLDELLSVFTTTIDLNTLLDNLDQAKTDVGHTHEVSEITDNTTLVRQTSSSGAFEIPKGNTAARPLNPDPNKIYFRQNTDTNQFEFWNGTSWEPFTGGATGSSGDQVFYLADQEMTADFTVPSNKYAQAIYKLSVKDGVKLSVEPNAVVVVT